MLAIRLYIAGLTLLLLFLVLAFSHFGFLEAIVITSSILYLILDVRADRDELQRLEKQASILSR